MFEGFTGLDVRVSGASIRGLLGGVGDPVLLLHGYPQTHAMWHPLADDLARDHAVVAADLRGYGDSVAYGDDFSFRAMAMDQVEMMNQLGHEQFHVVGHDRGARVAHRMMLDHPGAVRSVAMLDILPTLEVWRTMDAWLARRYYHWLFLAQPGEMPRRLISNDPLLFLHSALGGLGGSLETFHPDALRAYERAAQDPSVVSAWCQDYTAAATVDLEHDRADLGRTSEIPTLILWGSNGVVAARGNPLDAWRSWCPNATGHAIEAGHFLVEEQPDAVLSAVRAHLKTTETLKDH